MVFIESPLTCGCGGAEFRLQRSRNDDREGLPEEWLWTLAVLCAGCGALALSVATSASGAVTLGGPLVS